jgi:hypothetical protein
MNIFLGGECQVQGVGRRMTNNINVQRLIVLFNSLRLAGIVDYSIGKHRFEEQLNMALWATIYGRAITYPTYRRPLSIFHKKAFI